MNFKHLIIVSLILAILTMSVVSASEDIVSNETLSQSDTDDVAISEATQESSESLISQESSDSVVSQEIDEVDDDVLSYSEDDCIIEASDDSEDLLGDYSSGSVTIEVYSYIDITDKYSDLGYVYDEHGLKGTVTLTIDGKKVFSKKYTTGNKYYCYVGNENVDLKKIGYGYHTVKLTYNDGKTKSDSRKVNFVAIPTVNYPYRMSVGEDNGISIDGEKLNGTATLYNRVIARYEGEEPIYKKGNAIATVKITNGHGWIPLNKLTNGTYKLQLEYSFGTYEDVQTFELTVNENSDGFKSSLSATTITFGKTINAKLTGPKGEGYANIYIDNDESKYVRFNFGKMEETIQGLSVGKHRITLNYYDYDSDLFYSTTYKVVVKHAIKLKLPKVKVKKSAKKIVIKATLKIDGAVAKNKKLKFKFDNKKYTAKTNKKGVAKITIKKSVLKKLKKGKKVKYEVTYGDKTVEKTVKIKK